jgi:hypothetical protein
MDDRRCHSVCDDLPKRRSSQNCDQTDFHVRARGLGRGTASRGSRRSLSHFGSRSRSLGPHRIGIDDNANRRVQSTIAEVDESFWQLRDVPVKSCESKFAVDANSENWKAWANNVWPGIYLIDKHGRVRHWWYGELHWEGVKGEEFSASESKNCWWKNNDCRRRLIHHRQHVMTVRSVSDPTSSSPEQYEPIH